MLAPPRLRPASFDDYAEILRLESAHAMETMTSADWRRLYLESPLWPRLDRDWPIGWVLEDATGRIVGSLGNLPSLYMFQGRELLCANGRSWVVDPAYRAFSLMLMDEYFSQSGLDLFINTTVGPTAEPMIASLSTRIPLGDFQTSAYWAAKYRGLARRAWHKLRVPLPGLWAWPTAAALRLKDAFFLKQLPPAPATYAIEFADGFDARFNAFWPELLHQNSDKLLAVRDAQMLTWHYSTPLRLRNMWVVTASRAGLLRAYCVAKRQDKLGQLDRMRLIEFQSIEPDEPLLSGLVRVVLERMRAEGLDLLEHVGCGLPKMAAVDRYAPYRRKLPSWQYFYRATDPALARQLQRPEAWDPSMYDGDASFD